MISAMKRLYAALWDHPAALFALVDLDGNLVVQIGGSARGLPLPPGETGWAGVPVTNATALEVLRRSVAEDRSVSYRLRWSDSHGGYRHFFGVGHPWRGGSGRVKGCMFFALEIRDLEPELTEVFGE